MPSIAKVTSGPPAGYKFSYRKKTAQLSSTELIGTTAIYVMLDGGSNQLKFGRIDENGDVVLLYENLRTDFGIGYSEEGIKRKIEKRFFNPEVHKKDKLRGMVYTGPDW